MTDSRVLTVQDISCFGQCSITVALPIISACGVETAIIPGAVLSTHTGGFKGFTFRDLSEDIPKIEEHWVREGIAFECIYTGYLGSIDQIGYVKALFKSLLKDGGLKIVDPAMADNGKLYHGFDLNFVKEMATLCGEADILLPNITEASLMCGKTYKPGPYSREYIKDMLEALGKLGAKKIVLKGVGYDESKLGVVIYDAKSGEQLEYFNDKSPHSSHGTGDCFASAMTGAIMQDLALYDAAALAADFVVKCIEFTREDEDHRYGVKFEKALPMLVERLNK
ncbi:MAG TPA: pyridoxamine kinase [Bacillota bacterium]|nr:pyridoxamine kinase [Bacillota bacterium]